MEIIKNLQEQGLSEKEAKVYVACLELGDTTAGDVSFKSKLPRTLVYDLLSKLIEKGLIAYVIKNNIKYFKASEPQQFIKILKEKQKGNRRNFTSVNSSSKIKKCKRTSSRSI